MVNAFGEVYTRTIKYNRKKDRLNEEERLKEKEKNLKKFRK